MADTVHRSQLIQLRLNRTEREFMAKAAGCARVAYNWALAEWKRQAIAWWDSGKASAFPHPFALQKQFTAIKGENFPWFNDVGYQVAESAIFAVGQAYDAYKSGQSRYPRFKAKGGRRSFMVACKSRELRIFGNRITIPKLGRVRMTRAIRWPMATVTKAVISERAGKWYIALGFEMPSPAAVNRPGVAAGVDLGIKTPIVVTSGSLVINIGSNLAERMKVERRKLKRASRRMHRRVKGSGRRARARHQVARVIERMANIRSDMQHKATSLISSMASRIGIETLAVGNMMKRGKSFGRGIGDVGFYEIKRQLRYKADQVVEADRFFPSSKTCSACGSVKKHLALSDRIFICEDCGHTCDRDENAARNLERMAADWAVSARGARSPVRRRKLTLSSLASKREAKMEAST